MTSTIDQQFIEFIVKSLVGNPDAVSIARSVDEKGVLLELTVDADDLGRVIGKRGATAQSLRTLLRALGTKNEARYNLKIIDVNGEGNGPAPRQDAGATTMKSDDDVATEESTEEVAETIVEDDAPSDVVSKTRAELDELDDLDI